MHVYESVSRSIGMLQFPVVLFGLAFYLYLDPLSFEMPTSPQEIPAWVTDASTVRQRSPRPEYAFGKFTYGCQECHQMWPEAGAVVLTEPLHAEIRLSHGINDKCLNCHNRTNRDTFVDDAGESISWDSPQLMCAKCHGPVYRDWQHGAHGRSEGYWNPKFGKQIRRRCVECHDPHQPPFPPLEPAPGPNTFRMGPQDFEIHGQEHDPLHPDRDWAKGSGQMHGAADTPGHHR